MLFLTKPIGTGIMGTALKNGLETEDSAREVDRVDGGAQPPARRRRWSEVGVHAATDVTGFGLLGHLHEMAAASVVAV